MLGYDSESSKDDSLSIQMVPAPEILSVSPPRTLSTGGTKLMLSGMNFEQNKLSVRLVHVNGNRSVPLKDVIVISSSLAHCTMQSVDEGVWQLHATTTGVDFSSSSLSNTPVLMVFSQPLVVDRISPTLGPSRGGTVVRVIGSNFVDTPQLACKFGISDSSRVPALFISSEIITCTSPENAYSSRESLDSSSILPVFVTIDGQLWISSQAPVAFQYHQDFTFLGMSPKSGPSTGGTILLIRGIKFVTFSVPSCRFSSEDTSIIVKGSLLNDTALLCPSPALQAERDYVVSVSFNSEDFLSDDDRLVFKTYYPVRLSRVSPSNIFFHTFGKAIL